MTIDANELREAIAKLGEQANVPDQIFRNAPHCWVPRAALKTVTDALIATLPREAEVVSWVIVSGSGRIVELSFTSEDSAKRVLERYHPLDHQVVRLSGLVTLPPGGKD